MKWKKITFILFLIVLGCYNCALLHNKKNLQFEQKIPPGIDSLVFTIADSMADQLFVSYDKRLKSQQLTEKGKKNIALADSLWNKIELEESMVNLDTLNKAKNEAEKQYLLKQLKEDSLKRQIVREIVYITLNEVVHMLRTAQELDPFNLEVQSWLANAYSNLGKKFHNELDFTSAIKILENLTIFIKNEHALYERLGYNNAQLKKWDKACWYFNKAYDVLLATAFTNRETLNSISSIDSVDRKTLFTYLYELADAKAKLRNAEHSLALLKQALPLADSLNQEKTIISYIQWINWDNGNILASEMKDSLITLEVKEKFFLAYDGYKKLLETLKTDRAKVFVQWRMAEIEYYKKDEKEKAINCLADVIRKIPLDNKTQVPIDTLYQKYIDECGKLHYLFATECQAKADYSKAIQALSTAVSFKWDGCGICYLDLARLSVHSPVESIKYADQAINSGYEFNTKEKIEILNLKLRAYRRLGPQYMEEVQELSEQIRNLQRTGT